MAKSKTDALARKTVPARKGAAREDGRYAEAESSRACPHGRTRRFSGKVRARRNVRPAQTVQTVCRRNREQDITGGCARPQGHGTDGDRALASVSLTAAHFAGLPQSASQRGATLLRATIAARNAAGTGTLYENSRRMARRDWRSSRRIQAATAVSCGVCICVSVKVSVTARSFCAYSSAACEQTVKRE